MWRRLPSLKSPPLMFRFSLTMACRTPLIVIPRTAMALRSRVTWTSRSWPPKRHTTPTPLTRSMRGTMISSTSSQISFRSRVVSIMIHAIGLSSSLLTARVRDSSASGGIPVTRSSFSETSSRAMSLFVPQSNLRMIVDFPSMEVEDISRRLCTALSFSSNRSVISRSTSKGAAPRYSVSTVISGRSTVGIICTGRRKREMAPKRRARRTPTHTVTG